METTRSLASRAARTRLAARAALSLVLVFALADSWRVAAQQPAQQPQALTHALARQAIEAAEAEARRNDWNVTIVVTDAAGVPVQVSRLDGASARSFDVAMRKAATVVATQMATSVYGERLKAGQAKEVPDGVTFAGGVPVLRGGQFIGAIGTSGVAALDDERISNAGAAAVR